MLVYLDTNVLLSRYAPDEQHIEAKSLISRVESGKLAAVTSVLTLVEVACTTSRAYEKFNNWEGEMKREEVAGAFLRRVLRTQNLEFIRLGGELAVTSEERQVQVPALFALALEVGSRTGVKSLDALHLASASIASRIYSKKVDYFVTLDEDILKRHKEIRQVIESHVVSPASMKKQK